MINYIQENENVKDSAITTMLNDVTTAYKKGKKAGDTSFSNILNNLNSKTQKTQTNFVDKVAKTNTSSINRKVFDNNNASEKSAEAVQETNKPKIKNDTKSKNVNKQQTQKKDKQADTQNKADRKIKNKETTTKQTSLDNKISDENNVVQTDEKAVNGNNKTKETKENDFQLTTQKLSDINDNSSVEPSPIFLKEETTDNLQTAEISTNEIIADAGAILTVNSDNNQQSKDTLVDKAAEEIIQSSNIEQVVEEISQTLNEFNLTKDNEKEVKEALEKIKDIKAKENIEDFKNNPEVKAEIKEILSDLSDKLSLSDKTENVSAENNNTQTVNIETKEINLTQGETKEIPNTKVEFFNQKEETLAASNYDSDFKKPKVENIEVVSNEQINENETIAIDKNIQTENNDIIAKASGIKPTEANKNQNITTTDNKQVEVKNDNEIKITYDDEVQPTKTDEIEPVEIKYNQDIVYDDEQKITQAPIKNEFVSTEEIKYDDEEDTEIEFKQEVKLKDKVVLNEDSEKISSLDNKELTDLIKDNNSEIKENDLVAVAQTLKANNTNNTDKANNNIQVNKETVEDNSYTASKTVEAPKETAQNQNFAQNNKQNNDELNFTKASDNNIDIKNTKALKEEGLESDNIVDDVEVTEDNVAETKLYAKVEQNSDTKVENTEQNLEKLAFEQEKLNDMIVSMSKETQSTSALTVADEVAKIAINEDTSISSNVNIIYDSAGDNILLKNVQSVRPQENIFNQLQSKLESNNILNQITEKFEEIKNTLNQKFTMVLRPNDLGRLSIELTTGLKGLITNIVVQNEHVRSFIEKNINLLRNQLASAGVNVNQIQIKTAGTNDSSTYSGNQDPNHGEAQQETLKQNQNQNKQEQNRKQNFDNENLLASLSNFDTSFADDFTSVLNKTIGYGLN